MKNLLTCRIHWVNWPKTSHRWRRCRSAWDAQRHMKSRRGVAGRRAKRRPGARGAARCSVLRSAQGVEVRAIEAPSRTFQNGNYDPIEKIKYTL